MSERGREQGGSESGQARLLRYATIAGCPPELRIWANYTHCGEQGLVTFGMTEAKITPENMLQWFDVVLDHQRRNPEKERKFRLLRCRDDGWSVAKPILFSAGLTRLSFGRIREGSLSMAVVFPHGPLFLHQ